MTEVVRHNTTKIKGIHKFGNSILLEGQLSGEGGAIFWGSREWIFGKSLGGNLLGAICQRRDLPSNQY